MVELSTSPSAFTFKNEFKFKERDRLSQHFNDAKKAALNSFRLTNKAEEECAFANMMAVTPIQVLKSAKADAEAKGDINIVWSFDRAEKKTRRSLQDLEDIKLKRKGENAMDDVVTTLFQETQRVKNAIERVGVYPGEGSLLPSSCNSAERSIREAEEANLACVKAFEKLEEQIAVIRHRGNLVFSVQLDNQEGINRTLATLGILSIEPHS